jgi:NAD(P)H dehydrogenase (quinone)
MILVTGAAGKTGRAVIRAVVGRGAVVRALVHRPEQAAAVRALGAQEVVTGDMRRSGIMHHATRGVQAVYHICPNVHPDEVAIGHAAIEAAQRARLGHLVFHSVLHPQVEAMPHHWRKMRVEEVLLASGLAYTILQPAAYMQNVLAQRESVVQRGIYAVPYAVDTKLGMVDLADVAEVAAKVVAEPGHEGATYELCGPEILTQVEVANLMGRQLGQAVRAQAVPREAWQEEAREGGLSQYQVETLLKMFVYYEQHGFGGNPNVLACLLGRRPTGFASFLERVVAEWQER